MKITVGENGPMVEGLPPDNTILFFGRTCERGFCVVFTPPLPEKYAVAELFDAKVAFGQEGAEMDTVSVRHGHKYERGGGFVELKTHPGGRNIHADEPIIFWRLPEDERVCTFDGKRIEEVFISI